MIGPKKIEILKNIVDILKREGSVSIKMITETFGVSEITARRYVNEISKMDLPVKRVRGGLILETSKSSLEFMFDIKLSINEEEKRRITKKPLEFVEDGDSLILDSGTTAFYLAKELHKRKGLKVITVDVKVAEELAKNPNVETYIVGGRIRTGYFSVGGDFSLEFMKLFRADKVFLSADAVHPEEGITNSSVFEAPIKRAIAKMGKTVILIADHTKVGKIAFVKVVPINVVDVFITSEGADPELISEIRERGVEVILV